MTRKKSVLPHQITLSYSMIQVFLFFAYLRIVFSAGIRAIPWCGQPLTGCILQSMTLPANEIKIVKDSINDKIENIIVNYIASGTPSDSFTNELENEVKKARDHIQ